MSNEAELRDPPAAAGLVVERTLPEHQSDSLILSKLVRARFLHQTSIILVHTDLQMR